MSTRISSLIALTLLAGCGERAPQSQATTEQANGAALVSAAAMPDSSVRCAHQGEPLAANCGFDVARSERGLELTIRHPDGAFRRLIVANDGHDIVAADGAEPVVVNRAGGDRIELALGGDRYQLPATLGGAPARP